MKTSVVKRKNVVRVSDGSIAGRIVDFEFCPVSYQIQSVCIKEKQGLFNELFGLFTHDRVLVADVSRLVQIGKDVIMIVLPPVEKR